jgi:2'-5' RNA ligase
MPRVPRPQDRFLLTILPSPALAAEVERRRALLLPRTGSFSGRHNPPHITLCFADVPDGCEAAIGEAIALGVTGHRGFSLRYSDITHFPDKRTIYIDPVEKERIAPVRQSVVARLRDLPTIGPAVRETDHPHLTIAAGLKLAQFNSAWEMLAPHEWVSEERVIEVVLLRRELKPGSRYEHVRSFPLG